jgi:hypothetical protein
MDVWLLSGIGAVLIAAGQEIVAGVTAIWLRAHEAILGSLLSRDQLVRISGVDDQMDRAIRKTDGYLASAGRCSSPASSYSIPYFRQDGWRELSLA